MNVAFTFAGLRALGLPDDVLASFPEAFREGMAARAEQLGDRGPSAPGARGSRARHGDAHVLVTVYAVDAEHLRAALRRGPRRRRRAAASTLVHLQRAEALAGGRDHFGFFDGIAQPAVAGAGVAPRPGRRPARRRGRLARRRDRRGAARLRATRTARCPRRRCAPFDRNGTFVVYRKLQMDVAAFRRYVAAQARATRAARTLLAAKIVGRWPDGTPLALSPDAPGRRDLRRPARGSTTSPTPTTPTGCKLPARRPHPPRQPARLARLLRRPALQPPPDRPPRPRLRRAAAGRASLEDDGADRGLVFVCFQADIWRQFETIQALWVDDGDPFGLGARQGLPDRRAARHRGQDDDPRPPAVLPQAAAALRDPARRRVPVPAVDDRAARARRRASETSVVERRRAAALGGAIAVASGPRRSRAGARNCSRDARVDRLLGGGDGPVDVRPGGGLERRRALVVAVRGGDGREAEEGLEVERVRARGRGRSAAGRRSPPGPRRRRRASVRSARGCPRPGRSGNGCGSG